jgi:hypothetical protein
MRWPDVLFSPSEDDNNVETKPVDTCKMYADLVEMYITFLQRRYMSAIK